MVLTWFAEMRKFLFVSKELNLHRKICSVFLQWPVFLLLILAATVAGIGCGGTTEAMSSQLARVAKDWALMIRASQVIPVYPLTEDLQPGDVFLVRTRHESEIDTFKTKGYLPLDNLLVRLQPQNYAAFYSKPKYWPFSNDSVEIKKWKTFPRAAFPSYTFEVKKGAGLTLAVPVQAVPVAMSFLGAAQASGSISIADAYTYGIDMFSMHHRVKVWANLDSIKRYLVTFAPAKDDTNFNYLRVVNRVYLTSKVSVHVVSEEATGGKVSAAAPKPVDLLNLIPQDSTGQNYARVINALNQSIDTAAVGGTLKVVAASGRSMALTERFPRPLVFGYIAFDLPILEGGELGSPISTQGKLTQTPIIPLSLTYSPNDTTAATIERWTADPKNNDKFVNWLQQNGYNTGPGWVYTYKITKEYKQLRQRAIRDLIKK